MNVQEAALRSWAEVDLKALRANVETLRAHVGAKVGIMAVVKANAYGHGAGPVVGALRDSVQCFGVANLHEAQDIAAHTGPGRIQILGPSLPAERKAIVDGGFVPSVSSLQEAAAYSELAPAGVRVPLLVGIDTGMGRMGIWQEEAIQQIGGIAALPGVEIVGLASHLPVADEDDSYTESQLARFHALIQELGRRGVHAAAVHTANSAGIIGFPEKVGNLVRAGLALYGISPRADFQPKLKPVLTWKTRVTLVREVGPGRSISYGRTFISRDTMRVATLAVGYADGYQRHLSGQCVEVLIGGERCPVLGRVTMDQIVVDVSAVGSVELGAEAVLIGRQGIHEITAADLAAKAGTIPWEIFTGIGHRVERVYCA